jgi:hypothetical protein
MIFRTCSDATTITGPGIIPGLVFYGPFVPGMEDLQGDPDTPSPAIDARSMHPVGLIE